MFGLQFSLVSNVTYSLMDIDLIFTNEGHSITLILPSAFSTDPCSLSFYNSLHKLAASFQKVTSVYPEIPQHLPSGGKSWVNKAIAGCEKQRSLKEQLYCCRSNYTREKSKFRCE